jgi:uncharacterized OsmC-like protein
MTTVDATILRAMQRPLKERYQQDPAAAVTPVHGNGTFQDPGITCTVTGWAGPVRAGLHPATGGDGSDACSGDMLLEALVACAGVTMRSVATAMRLSLSSVRIVATGAFDARGTLGLSRDVPVGLIDVELIAEVETDADDAALEKLAQLTERYCVVGQSLAEPPSLHIRRIPPDRTGGVASESLPAQSAR